MDEINTYRALNDAIGTAYVRPSDKKGYSHVGGIVMLMTI